MILLFRKVSSCFKASTKMVQACDKCQIGVSIITLAFVMLCPVTGYAHTKHLPEKQLSPTIRVIPLDNVHARIPIETIRPFLTGIQFVTPAALEQAPEILSNRANQVVLGNGDLIYAKDINDTSTLSYQVIDHDLIPVFDESVDDERPIGYIAAEKGVANVEAFGQPAKLRLQHVKKEIMNGDKLVINNRASLSDIEPVPAKAKVDTKILHVFGGVNQIGRFTVVAIKAGDKQGLKVGDLLGVYQPGITIRDTTTKKFATIKNPDEKAGELMIFRTFSEVSFAIVLNATDVLTTRDRVAN